jgi:hypothetical protein
MSLLIPDGPRVKGLKVLFSGILIAFGGFLIAFATGAFGLAQVVMVVGWVVAAIGFVWHLAIMLGVRRKGPDTDKHGE